MSISGYKLFHLLLAAFFTAALPLAAYDPAYDEALYMALQNEGLSRAELLVDAAALNPAEPQTALALLNKTPLSEQDTKKLARKYEVLWKKNPSNAPIVMCGISLFLKAKISYGKILELLKLADTYIHTGQSPDKRNTINTLRLSFHLNCGDNAGAEKFAASLDLKKQSSELLHTYHILHYRAKVSGDREAEKRLRERYLAAVTQDVENMRIRGNYETLFRAMEKSYSAKRPEHGKAIYDMVLANCKQEKVLKVLKTVYCMCTPDYGQALAITKEFKAEKDLEDEVKFQAALNCGQWHDALRIVAGSHEKRRNDRLLIFALKKQDGKILKLIGNDTSFSPEIRASAKLFAAGLLNDVKLYREARQLFSKQKLSIDNMNSIAYTAAELGVDLKESENMLRKVVAAAPGNAAYLDSLAYVCFKRKLYAEAQKYIELAIKKVTPDIPAAVLLDHAGDIAKAQGDLYKAQDYYRRALEMPCDDDRSFNAELTAKKLKELE